jgi:lipopolysaccharide export system permease protein
MALIFNETVVPLSNRAADNIMRYEVAKERPSLLKERIFLREESGGRLNRVIYINVLKPRLGVMSEILIQEFEKGHLRKITTAEKGIWDQGQWVLQQGEVFNVDTDGKVSSLYKFKDQKISLDLNPGQVAMASRDPEDMGIVELAAHMALLRSQGANILPLKVMYHLRLAIPWATVVLALVGSALGVRPQRTGAGVGFGLSIIIVFAYYVVMSICRALGQAGNLPALIAAWLPNIVFLLFGAFLTRRVNH